MKAKLLVVVIASLLFNPALFAAEGEVSLSSTAQDCFSPEKETNTLNAGDSGRIWINVPATKSTVGLQYTITEKGNPIVNPTTFSLTGCGDGYFFSDISLPSVQGSVTLTVLDSEGAEIGSDTFVLE